MIIHDNVSHVNGENHDNPPNWGAAWFQSFFRDLILLGIQKPLVPRGKEDRSLRLPPPTQPDRNAYWPPFIREAP